MKIILIILLCSLSTQAFSQTDPQEYLRKIVRIIEKGNYELGSRELYRLSKLNIYEQKQIQIRYTLGIAFLKMKLYHLASFQFVFVIKHAQGNYKYKAVEKLSPVLDYFQDDPLFCSLSSYIKVYPISVRNRMNFYFGKCAYFDKKFQKATSHFSRVTSKSKQYSLALYYKALAYAEQNKVKTSAYVFKKLASKRQGITDKTRVAALMGLARVLYQAKKFEDSIKIYRTIPKDTKYFHESLSEISWNYLRLRKFRSALSNFHTLHSLFYKDHYQPESLILRAYIYLYICEYEDMEKVLNLFNALYLPLIKDIKKSLRWGRSYNSYLNAVLSAKQNRDYGLSTEDGSILPKVIMNRIMKSSKFQSLIYYLKKLIEEKQLVESLPAKWRQDRVGQNAISALNRRINFTRLTAGKTVRQILLQVLSELKKLQTSEQYLRYDMLKGRRDFFKKKIITKRAKSKQIDEKISRNYYVKNGYEYWPYDGETWLDELGNYHYLGKQNCE